MKVFMFFIHTVYWLWLFIVPAGILSFVAYLLYLKDVSNFALAIIIAGSGIVLGIFFAEKVRKKYGLSNFFGGMAGRADLDGKDIAAKNEEEK
ncbi:hypothetical protein [Ferruginibacter sp. SUN106]|uniref:hypothetical protein n=1 Tax=Ferruginibacter sp. SUN106 TaxID=2978348 RepID=UPI003D3638A1